MPTALHTPNLANHRYLLHSIRPQHARIYNKNMPATFPRTKTYAYIYIHTYIHTYIYIYIYTAKTYLQLHVLEISREIQTHELPVYLQVIGVVHTEDYGVYPPMLSLFEEPSDCADGDVCSCLSGVAFTFCVHATEPDSAVCVYVCV
jgi:hypothetical protein